VNFELDKIRVPLWLIWAISISLAIAGFGYWYYEVDPGNSKLVGLVGGIVTGLIVYLATFLTLLRPIQELDRFHRMGIRGLLANRHDQTYYRKLVARSRLRVDVMGASCSRFVRDFLDVESDDKVLIDALIKHPDLKVRLLIPDDAHMSEETRNRTKDTLAQFAVVQGRFGNRVELRRFEDEARHSLVIVDNDLVAGPVFDDNRSRHAPAVHVAIETLFGQKYLAYFETVWDAAYAGA
jgi:hypothetical protein